MNWTKVQAIVMAIGLIGGAMVCYANIQSTLATHGTKLDAIEQHIATIDDSLARVFGHKYAEH